MGARGPPVLPLQDDRPWPSGPRGVLQAAPGIRPRGLWRGSAHAVARPADRSHRLLRTGWVARLLEGTHHLAFPGIRGFIDGELRALAGQMELSPARRTPSSSKRAAATPGWLWWTSWPVP